MSSSERCGCWTVVMADAWMLLPGVRSTYRWQGQVECADEVLLLIKSTRERYPALAARLRELHSYELPEIIAVDVSVADPAYQAWVESQVKPD